MALHHSLFEYILQNYLSLKEYLALDSLHYIYFTEFWYVQLSQFRIFLTVNVISEHPNKTLNFLRKKMHSTEIPEG